MHASMKRRHTHVGLPSIFTCRHNASIILSFMHNTLHTCIHNVLTMFSMHACMHACINPWRAYTFVFVPGFSYPRFVLLPDFSYMQTWNYPSFFMLEYVHAYMNAWELQIMIKLMTMLMTRYKHVMRAFLLIPYDRADPRLRVAPDLAIAMQRACLQRSPFFLHACACCVCFIH